jgi:hypothetical protein
MNPNGFYETFVKGIYQGSPADRSGVITEGDTLLEVNGENVRGLSLQQVAPLITGLLNTPIQLGFKPGKEAKEAGPSPSKPQHRQAKAICPVAVSHQPRLIRFSTRNSEHLPRTKCAEVCGNAQAASRPPSTTQWTSSARRSIRSAASTPPPIIGQA